MYVCMQVCMYVKNVYACVCLCMQKFQSKTPRTHTQNLWAYIRMMYINVTDSYAHIHARKKTHTGILTQKQRSKAVRTVHVHLVD